jgi:hypothetical protein
VLRNLAMTFLSSSSTSSISIINNILLLSNISCLNFEKFSISWKFNKE